MSRLLDGELDSDLDFIFSPLVDFRVSHSRLNKWREELTERVWRQRALAKRAGTVGPDGETLLEDLPEFAFVEEIAVRTSKKEKEAI